MLKTYQMLQEVAGLSGWDAGHEIRKSRSDHLAGRVCFLVDSSSTPQSYLTIRPVALAGYGSIAYEAKPNGLLTLSP